YILNFRNAGIFYEYVTNRILDDFVKAVNPRRVEVTGKFSTRGGITTSVHAREGEGEKNTPEGAVSETV
ncbi:MAG: hypothetical protein ACE5GH_07775, partial [Fidelibacterota bacterium]